MSGPHRSATARFFRTLFFTYYVTGNVSHG